MGVIKVLILGKAVLRFVFCVMVEAEAGRPKPEEEN